MGWRDVGFMGSKYYETPNIDKLAKRGMIFSQAYASASNSAPSWWTSLIVPGRWKIPLLFSFQIMEEYIIPQNNGH